MSFVSVQFGILLFLVMSLSFIGSAAFRFVLLLSASLLFYAWAAPAQLGLLLAVAAFAWGGALLAERPDSRIPAALLTATILLLILGYFKYANFALDIGTALGRLLGLGAPPRSLYLDVVLPVGISFFTFQAIAYVVDVRRGEVKAERSYFWVLLFLSFFPQLVAGPIERSRHLLPQLRRLVAEFPARADISGGLFLVLAGVFLKFVIADNLSEFVTPVYAQAGRAAQPQTFATDAFLGVYFFSLQIYGDFYGYTLIALGCGRMLGVHLTNNFAHPYFAANIQDFWRRWHITLTTFFRDYVYIPLGGNKRGTLVTLRNLILIMLLVGLWHGANYTFVLWGAAHALYLAAHRLFQLQTQHSIDRLPALARHGYAALCWFVTFNIVSLTWILFRSPDLQVAETIFSGYLQGLGNILTGTFAPHFHIRYWLLIAGVFVAFAVIDRWGSPLKRFSRLHLVLQVIILSILLALTYVGSPLDVQFIYFQF